MKTKRDSSIILLSLSILMIIAIIFLPLEKVSINKMSLIIGFLASLLVLSISTIIEYFIAKRDAISTFIESVYHYLNLVVEANVITIRATDTYKCFEKWNDVNDYFQTVLFTNFFKITKYYLGKTKYMDIYNIYGKIDFYNYNFVEKTISYLRVRLFRNTKTSVRTLFFLKRTIFKDSLIKVKELLSLIKSVSKA